MEKIVTASLVTYKTDRDELATVLRCLCDSPVQRIYIVDNSPDDSLRDFGDFHPFVEYIGGHGNVGYGAGHNIGIRKALDRGADYHLVLNSDIYFEPGTVEALVAYMQTRPDVGQVMPRIVSPEGETQFLCKLLPTPMTLIFRRFIPVRSFIDRYNSRYEMRSSGYDRTMEVPFLSGCFMFLRADTLEKIGGFSDRYWMYCEDIDLCRRMGDIARTVYYPGATVTHAHKKESYRSRRMMLAHIKSAVTYFNRWGWLFDRERRIRNKAATRQY